MLCIELETRLHTHKHFSVIAWPIKYLVRIPAPMLNIHLFSKMNKEWAIDAFICMRIWMSLSDCMCVCVCLCVRLGVCVFYESLVECTISLTASQVSIGYKAQLH